MLFLNLFKDKFDKYYFNKIPTVMQDKLTKNYSIASKLDNNCKLLTTFHEYLYSYHSHQPINWVWECHQQTTFNGTENEFLNTFSRDCVFDKESGIVDCKKKVNLQTTEARLVDFLFTSGSLLTPPTDGELSPEFYKTF